MGLEVPVTEQPRRYGVPRTEEERRLRHEELYPGEPLPPRGAGLTRDEVQQIAELAAEKAVQKVMEEQQESELLLHSLPYLEGSPGIVWDEELAKRTPCHCVDNICFSKGIIGACSAEQREWACKPRMDIERPGLRRRIERWQAAVATCKSRLEREVPVDGEKRVLFWLRCMQKEVAK